MNVASPRPESTSPQQLGQFLQSLGKCTHDLLMIEVFGEEAQLRQKNQSGNSSRNCDSLIND
jgi:hypothetical protein